MKKTEGSKKNPKITKIVIISLIVVILVVLSIFVKFKSPFYASYYREACKEQKEKNNYQDRINSTDPVFFIQYGKVIEEGKFLKLCMNTGGCYFNGSTCIPSERLKIIEYPKELSKLSNLCTTPIVHRCVCPFGTTFDSGPTPNSEEGCA